jgi:hypothetical protein
LHNSANSLLGENEFMFVREALRKYLDTKLPTKTHSTSVCGLGKEFAEKLSGKKKSLCADNFLLM